MTTTDRNDGPRWTAEALLREGAWVRRLAQGLVDVRAEAEDLSQDVLAAALASRPPLDGARLRGWLGAVARRMATRRRERERARRHAERRAALPEAEGQAARSWLALHRRLVAEIEALDEPERTALVLRYLEDLPPRLVAERLDVSVAAARKRVSRGLAILRARLERDFGGQRGAGCTVGAALLRGPEGPAPAAVSLPGVVTLLLPKKLALGALGAALAVTLLVVSRVPRGAGTPGGPAPGSSTVARPLPTPPEDESAPTVDTGSGERRAAVVVPAVTAPPRVKVVDEQGSGLPGARVAWIDASGRVQGLTLGADGGATRPPGSAGARFFADALGCAEGWTEAGPQGDDVLLVLVRSAPLVGRLAEDGGVPERPVFLRLYAPPHAGLRVEESALDVRLEELGVRRRTADTWTRSDGSFALEGLGPGRQAWLHLPSTHRFAVAGFPSRRAVQVGGGELVLETTRLPTIRGRAIWAEDGAPVRGRLWAVLREGRRHGDDTLWQQTDANGRFEIGLPVEEAALLQPPDGRADALLHQSLRLGVDEADRVARPGERTYDLAGLDFPHDLGEIRFASAVPVHLRVLGPAGEPVKGAGVATTLERVRTDEEGAAEIHGAQDDPILVLAPGCAVGTFAVPAVPTRPDRPTELRLHRGCTLAVRLAGEVRDAALRVQLAWEATPFELPEQDPQGRYSPYPSRVHRAFHGSALEGGSSSFTTPAAPGHAVFVPPSSGELLVPGLVGGSAFTVRVVDRLNQVLLERDVTLPPEAGVHVIGLSAGDPEVASAPEARLRARLVDEEGQSIREGSVLVRGRTKRGRAFGCDARGLVDAGPFAAGPVDLVAQAPGHLPRELAGHVLEPGAPETTLVLERARSLSLTVFDADGSPVSPFGVRAVSGEDEWSPDAHGSEITERFHALPLRPLQIRFRAGTRDYRVEVDARQTDARAEVPVHGRLVVRVESLRDVENDWAGDWASVEARVREARGDGERVVRRGFDPREPQPLELATDLLPGVYSLEVDLRTPAGDGEARVPLIRDTIEVVAGRNTDLSIPR